MSSDIAELRAEIQSLRAMMLVIAPLVCQRDGLSAASIESIGTTLANSVNNIEIEGMTAEALQEARTVKAAAVADLFSSIANLVRLRSEGEPEFGG